MLVLLKDQLNLLNRERAKITNIQNKRGTTNIGKIMECYEQFYAKKLNNLDELYKFFEKYNSSKLTQDETENLNSPVSILKK